MQKLNTIKGGIVSENLESLLKQVEGQSERIRLCRLVCVDSSDKVFLVSLLELPQSLYEKMSSTPMSLYRDTNLVVLQCGDIELEIPETSNFTVIPEHVCYLEPISYLTSRDMMLS